MRKINHTIVQAIYKMFTDDNWTFQYSEENGLFHFNLAIEGRLKSLKYNILVREDGFTVYANSPIGADATSQSSIARMSELTTRINYGMWFCNFEHDMRDGELRLKCHITCQVAPSTSTIQESIFFLALVFEKYEHAIIVAACTTENIEKAVEECENQKLEEFLK